MRRVRTRWIVPIAVVVSVAGCTETPPKETVTVLTTSTATSAAPELVTVGDRPTVTLEGYPPAASGSVIPWNDVEAGWQLVVFDGSKFGEPSRRPVVLYLVSPAAEVYQVAALSGAARILDWAPSGRSALLGVEEPSGHTLMMVDLATGQLERLAAGAPGPVRATFTRPNARNLVMVSEDGRSLHRVKLDGEILAVLAEAAPMGETEFDWLISESGASLVIGTGNKLWHASLDGEVVKEFKLPKRSKCRPIRWTGSSEVLVACQGVPDASPHPDYTQLWRFDVGSGEGTALTPYTGKPKEFDNSDWGYVDALGDGSRLVLQWMSECSPGNVLVERSGESRPLVWSPIERFKLIDLVDAGFVVQSATQCDGSGSRLLWYDTVGQLVRILVTRNFDSIGVVDARGFGGLPMGA